MILLVIAVLLTILSYTWNVLIQPAPFYLLIIISLCSLLIISEVRRSRLNGSCGKWILIIIGFLVFISAPWLLTRNDNSALTYWGAVIGGVASGSIAVVGVYATISYYKKSDADKARIAIRPFFEIIVTKAYPLDIVAEKPIWIANAEDGALLKFKINCRNIGDGFAQIKSIGRTRDDTAVYQRIVYSHEVFELTLHLPENPDNDEFSFLLDFEDALGNEYTQEVTVVRKRNTSYYHVFYGSTKQPILISEKVK